jgi:hypothetical protein
MKSNVLEERCIVKNAPITNFFIYVFVDPENYEVRYVGQTRWGIERIHRHFTNTSLKDGKEVHNWINELLAQKKKPLFFILESFASDDKLNDRETTWHSTFTEIGCRLTNMTSGGGPKKKTGKARDKDNMKWWWRN